MSFIHYLFLGQFEHDGEVVRFAKNSSDAAYQPVVRQPLDAAVVKAVLREVTAAKVNGVAFPDDWIVWLAGGCLVCEKYARNPAAINFISRLVERTHCEIYDVGAHCDIALRDWLAVTEVDAKPSLTG